jgi:hypothetical protein
LPYFLPSNNGRGAVRFRAYLTPTARRPFGPRPGVNAVHTVTQADEAWVTHQRCDPRESRNNVRLSVGRDTSSQRRGCATGVNMWLPGIRIMIRMPPDSTASVAMRERALKTHTHHALFAAAICADVANDRGFGVAHSASDFAADDSARSTGASLLPALGSVPLGMITRAPSRERSVPSSTTRRRPTRRNWPLPLGHQSGRY